MYIDGRVCEYKIDTNADVYELLNHWISLKCNLLNWNDLTNFTRNVFIFWFGKKMLDILSKVFYVSNFVWNCK